jgi:hypothetical protein
MLLDSLHAFLMMLVAVARNRRLQTASLAKGSWPKQQVADLVNPWGGGQALQNGSLLAQGDPFLEMAWATRDWSGTCVLEQ